MKASWIMLTLMAAACGCRYDRTIDTSELSADSGEHLLRIPSQYAQVGEVSPPFVDQIWEVFNVGSTNLAVTKSGGSIIGWEQIGDENIFEITVLSLSGHGPVVHRFTSPYAPNIAFSTDRHIVTRSDVGTSLFAIPQTSDELVESVPLPPGVGWIRIGPDSRWIGGGPHSARDGLLWGSVADTQITVNGRVEIESAQTFATYIWDNIWTTPEIVVLATHIVFLDKRLAVPNCLPGTALAVFESVDGPLVLVSDHQRHAFYRVNASGCNFAYPAKGLKAGDMIQSVSPTCRLAVVQRRPELIMAVPGGGGFFVIRNVHEPMLFPDRLLDKGERVVGWIKIPAWASEISVPQ